jgi:DNA-binding NtrC family response regulator
MQTQLWPLGPTSKTGGEKSMEKRRNILVVEDNPDWRQRLDRILRNEGYNVTTVETYAGALSELGRQHFHLASIDLSLEPDDPENREGMTFLSDVVDMSIPAIIVSGYGAVQDIRKALKELGAFYFFEKRTFDKEKYLGVVKDALALGPVKATVEEKARMKEAFGVFFRGEILD